jgi:molybdopterin molybdotransferase
MLKKAVQTALLENDIILLSGGSSVGTRDLTARVFEEFEGSKQLFHGISIKPGKPTLAAIIDNKLLVGLPGHPASAMIVFDVIISPIIAGRNQRARCTAYMAANVASAPGRQDYVRVCLKEEHGKLIARPILGKSGLITTIVESDGFVVIPLDKEGISAGEEVEVELYEGR